MTLQRLRRDLDCDFEEQIIEVMHEVIGALREYDGRAENYWLKNFPHGSCNVTSWVIGSLLLELGYEDYGQWFLVSRWSDRKAGAVYDVSH